MVVEALLNLGADPQEIWKEGIRPLHLAAELGNIHILAAILLSLIEQTMNFQLNAETEKGKDPLDIAIENDHLECVAMLCQSGLQIKQKHLQLAHELSKTKISAFLKKKATEQGGGLFQVQYVTKESLYESVQSEGDPNMPNEKNGINNRIGLANSNQKRSDGQVNVTGNAKTKMQASAAIS